MIWSGGNGGAKTNARGTDHIDNPTFYFCFVGGLMTEELDLLRNIDATLTHLLHVFMFIGIFIVWRGLISTKVIIRRRDEY